MSKNKKLIISSIIIVIALIITICFAISANAENTGGTADQREDEKTLVRMTAGLSMGSDTNNKINITSLGYNLNKYIGSGRATVTQTSSDVLTVTFVATGNTYQVNVNTGPLFDGGSEGGGAATGGITSLGTYLPTGFTEVAAASATTGLTIQDGAGNQYVWVEVPKTTTVYPTAGLGITEFTTDEYTKIENDLHTYTSDYRNGTEFKDEYSGNDASTGLTSTQYTELKNKMLKSVYQNGGFYVGKYETGSTVARESENDELTTPVIQANAYPYNFVTNSQAQSLASGMSGGGYTTSLMFGVQWDLVLKYLETKGVSQSLLNSDSTTIGNYNNNSWNITNGSAKYYTDATGWQTGLSGAKPASRTLLSTGADSTFSKIGIYDIAGNVDELTLEYTSDSSYPCAVRGGYYNYSGRGLPASSRNYGDTTTAILVGGFRLSLY